jgi:hypothetical protein
MELVSHLWLPDSRNMALPSRSRLVRPWNKIQHHNQYSKQRLSPHFTPRRPIHPSVSEKHCYSSHIIRAILRLASPTPSQNNLDSLQELWEYMYSWTFSVLSGWYVAWVVVFLYFHMRCGWNDQSSQGFVIPLSLARPGLLTDRYR